MVKFWDRGKPAKNKTRSYQNILTPEAIAEVYIAEDSARERIDSIHKNTLFPEKVIPAINMDRLKQLAGTYLVYSEIEFDITKTKQSARELTDQQSRDKLLKLAEHMAELSGGKNEIKRYFARPAEPDLREEYFSLPRIKGEIDLETSLIAYLIETSEEGRQVTDNPHFHVTESSCEIPKYSIVYIPHEALGGFARASLMQ